ncbi:PP2C family protein-serine/threonine phosphatase [Streptomyces peucetius]|uniref:Serine/threonine-protein phosphatase n=1 Tax=Streptomyces peucetius TaxID=1950 RepID=A0ABY6IKX5_STRPE|nr:PP2C family protein-serine/threonine phosphatase [Streptomyces peucetius]UYQ66355.1 serine/threonine-protein phosphatase [Streptomyces peucetius]
MLSGLLTDSHVMSFEELPARVGDHAATAGFSDVLIYLADLQRDVLRLFTGAGKYAAPAPEGHPAEVPVEGSVAGRAYQYGSITPTGKRPHSWWVPLLDGTERLGLLHLAGPADDEDMRDAMLSLSSLVAMLVVGRRNLSDTYARLIRSGPMNVAAEMQWQLMPPRTYADGRVTIAAGMEPAYQISGDAYDYATAGDVVHLSLFDAMGHDTAAGLTANLAIGACRNRRREGTGLADLGDAIEQEMLQQFGADRYVTGILADLDTTTGVLTWTNRGHHPPVLIHGGRSTRLLDCPPAHPMGTDLGLPAVLRQEQLQPGDRLVLYTDGITEARTRGQEFGLTAFTDFLLRQHTDGLPVPETLRRLMRAHLNHHNRRLQDDATIVLCEWHGPHTFSTRETASLAGVPLADS